MKQSEKLKVVFDFIADYLTEDDKPKKVKKKKKKKKVNKKPTTKELITEGDVVSNGEDKLSRAYQIIKRLDDAKKRGEILGRDNISEALKNRGKFDLKSFKSIDDDIKKAQEDFYKKDSKVLKKLLDDAKSFEKRLSNKEATEKKEAIERLGVTLDDEGKVVEVKVKALTEGRGEIETHITQIMESGKKTKKEK